MHVDDLGLGDLDPAGAAGAALGLDGHLDGDRGAAAAQRLGVEADQVADEDRRVKDHLAHGDGDQAPGRVPMRLDRARLVDVRQDDAAEDGAQGVGVLGHHDHADRGL